MNAQAPLADSTPAGTMDDTKPSDAQCHAAPGPRAAAARHVSARRARAASWRWALGALALSVAAVLASYWETASNIAQTWWVSSAFSHGLLIVPIVAFLIWRRRAHLAANTPRPSILGLIVVAIAALAWLIGQTAGVQLIQEIAMITVFQGLFLAVLGLTVSTVIAFPLFYLYFSVPIGTFLIQPLQDLTAAFIVRVLQTIGIPVYLDGIFLYIPSGSFEVAEACAGLRFLITSIALGAIFAHIFYRQFWRRALLVALSAIVPIVANGFRASGIVLLAHYSDYEIAVGADHITYGLIFLSMVLLCLLGIGYSFREPVRESYAALSPIPVGGDAPPSPVTWLRFSAIAGCAAAIVAASWAYAARIEGHASAAPFSPRPPALEDWRAVPPAHADWNPTFPNVSQELLQGFTDGVRHVDLYVAYFAAQRQGAEAVNWSNSLAGAAPWLRAGSGRIETEPAGQKVAVNYDRIVARNRARMVWYWYWVDGRLTVSPYVAKLLEVRAKLFGGEQAAAVIALAADYGDDPRIAKSVLSQFLPQIWPIDRVFGRKAP